MRKSIKLNQAGFTLFEVIVVLILLGIMAVGLTLGLVKIVESYVFTQEATQLSQKAQLAMARMKKELTDVSAVTYISASRIDYTRPYAPPSCQREAGCSFRIQQADNALYLEGITPQFTRQILIDQVAQADAAGQVFLTFKNFSGTSWTVETNNAIDNLAQIIVSFSVAYGVNQTIAFNTTINPRSGERLNIPKLN